MSKAEAITAAKTMKRPPIEVLKKVIEDAVMNGYTYRSLRAIAETSGISHRMLIYHFGSQQGLWTAIINDVRDSKNALFESEMSHINSVQDLRRFFIAFWRSYESEDARKFMLLYFETYTYALRHPDEYREFLNSVLQPQVDTIASLFRKVGYCEDDADKRARLLLAATRGFFLDMITTGDTMRIESAGLCLLDLILT